MNDKISLTMLPARDGDCLFVEARGFRILIDGGRSQTGGTELPAFLATLPSRPGRPDIDLMVLTHIDADHIAGLLTFLANLGETTIGEVWFNGIDHHKLAADIFVKSRPTDEDCDDDALEIEKTLGLAQALNFDRVIQSLKLPWNQRIDNEPVMVLSEGALPRIELVDGLVLVLLGPPKEKLAEFYPEWQDYVGGKEDKKTLAARPQTVPTPENLRALATQDDSPDKTKPNGASIAFILEAGEKRLLLAADAHPDDLANGLQRYSATERVRFDAIKISHHGSARNNTSQLIEKLQSPYWLISTDGSRHGHPDTEALARIVLAPDKGKKLVFNYRKEVTAYWDNAALKEAFDYKTCYGDEQAGITIVF